MVLVAFGISHFANAQKKYAVLITGDYATKDIPSDEQYNSGQGRSDYGYDEFWNDTFLMWKLLQKKGYSQENIIVLFANGSDFTFPGQAEEYKPEDPSITVTDYSASIANVNLVFNGLAHGLNGFPRVTENDFLFIWTFDHGGTTWEGNSILHLIDGNITDVAFANLVNPIQAHKKVFWMQQCSSGGFADNLSANNTFFHSASRPNQSAYRADDRTKAHQSVIENEERNGKIYNHGEFDFHIYSVTNGASPADFTDYFGEPYTNADTQSTYQGNNDGFISMKESSEWEKLHESGPATPLIDDPGNIGAYTSLEYPTLIWEDVVTNQTERGIIAVTKDVHIVSGKKLHLLSNSDIFLLNNANLIVDSGATLIIEDNVNISSNYSNKIIVNGNITIGSNVDFIAEGNIELEVILNNSNMQTNINNVTFNKTKLINYGKELTILNSNFNNCGYTYSYNGDVEINNCIFANTWLYVENQQNISDISADVRNSVFNNPSSHVGIDMVNYDNYWISNNDIKAYHNGIQISNCGNNNYATQKLKNNTIHDCGQTGVLAYNTKGAFYKNHIYNNKTGIKMLDKCNMALYGNHNANSNYETNFITNNDSYEIYISKYSFPWYFRYNVIVDEDNAGNPSDPMLYFSYPSGGKINQKDIKYNCWGTNFLDYEDLYPYEYFLWNPTWCPGGSAGEINSAAQMYNDGRTQLETQQYAEAKATFMLLIDTYPKTEYAVSAMKELISIEKYTTNDYALLKEYYQTNDSIQQDSILQDFSFSLANDCDIKLQKWSNAIDYYEAHINNPVSLEDSVFSIIDLGYVYFLMENSGDKSSYIGQLPQYKPKSKEDFFEHRDYLLSLLPGKGMNESIKEDVAVLKEGTLLQNNPNPTQGITTIGYQLEKEVKQVSIVIYDYTGKSIQRIDGLSHKAGKNSTEVNLAQLPAGTYFYSLFVNGHKLDTQKLVLIH